MRRARLALRLLRRDWRAGELRLLAAAVVVAVAAVSAVSWLAERVGGAGGERAAELLGADRAVRSAEPIPEEWLQQARELGLAYARSAEFPSVVLAGDATQLVSVKAVERGYPLRGSLQVSDSVDAPAEAVRAVPPSGTVWVEPRLLPPLALAVGDSLGLGEREFRVARLLRLEPDRGGFFDSVAPRVMLNYDDLASTGLIQPASRVRYQLLLAGPEPALERFHDWLVRQELRGVRWRTPEDASIGVREVMLRAKRFLGLSALLTVVIAGVAMLLTVRRYAARQVDRVAVMRCMGATAGEVTALFAWKLFWLGLFAGAAGLALGFGLHWLMLGLVAELLPAELPALGWRPALAGWLTAFAALLGFALPTVLRLRRVPPLRVLRRELGQDVFGGASLYLAALATIFLLMWWQAEDLKLAALVGAAVLATLAALALLAWGLVRGLRKVRARGGRGLLWLSGLTRRPATAAVQIMGVGVGLMALFLLTVVRQDLLDAWRGSVPADAPNYFLVNIQPEQVDALRTRLRAEDIDPVLHPMIRARLIAINDRPVRPEDYQDERAQRLVAREFNLSYGTALSPDNRVVAGDWWGERPADPRTLSVEQGLAKDLGIALGDRLAFQIGGEAVTGTVGNLRQVKWDSFNVNFFVLAPPGLLEDYPTTYITSFHLPPQRQPLLTELVRRFPSVTVFDIGNILATVRGIVDQGVRVVELMAALTLLAGVIVLLAALQITGEERRFESALLRALGASRASIRRLARAEFLLIGGLSGALAGACAALAGYVLARQLFELSYPFNPWLPPLGAFAGALVVWLTGGAGSRRYYRGSPMRLLRGGDD